MFSGFPPRTRRIIQSALSASWMLAAGAGISTLTVEVVELGPYVTTALGGLLAVASLVAASGVIWNRYHWEWVASWVAALALAPYPLTLWSLYIVHLDANDLPQAFLASSLLGFILLRALFCGAHAEKLRLAHVAEVAVTDAIEGEGPQEE